MQVTLLHHKSTKSAIKNPEMQVGPLVKEMDEKHTRTFMANTKKNPKEECKAVITRSQKKKDVEKADGVLEDVSKGGEDDTKREEDDERQEKDDEVLIPMTKSQLT